MVGGELMRKWTSRAPAGRIAYVNGRYVPHGAGGVHIEDRGYQLADGIYEVCEVRGSRLIDEDRHMRRLPSRR